MAKKEGLRLVIELDPDEAEEFRRLTKTKNASFYEGIAKSLVLGAGKVVDPQLVSEDIELLATLAEYGRHGSLPAKQEWADELSFTREQLQKQKVRDAICSWAVYFGGEIDDLFAHRFTPAKDQYRWFGYSGVASILLESLKNLIKSNL